MISVKLFLASVLSCALILATSGCASMATYWGEPAVQNQEVQAAAPSGIQPAQMTPEQLQQLVAPIALYPDQLVAQILAASTYPTEVVEADRWVQQNSSLKGEALGKAINEQRWDPSVKALAEFPSVLHNMSQNLAWTSNLGDAYFNEPKGVMAAIQVLR